MPSSLSFYPPHDLPDKMQNGPGQAWKDLADTYAPGAIYNSQEREPHSKCLLGTRVDFLESLREIVKSGTRNIVWVVGDPGSGKSTIAHTFADELRQEGLLAGTFFFSRNTPQRSTFDLVFLTLAYQLGSQHHIARDIITKAISDDPSLLHPAKSRLDQLENLVVRALECLKSQWADKCMTIIMDALDEGASKGAAHIEPFISLVIRLLRNSTLPIRNVIISSRPWPEIEAVMRSAEFTDIIRIKQLGESRGDVTRYLRHAFRRIYISRGLSRFCTEPWPSERDFSMLSERSDGRFIFAATIIRQIDQERPYDRLLLVCGMLRGKVRRVWGDVHDLYESIINDIKEPICKEGLYYLSLILNLYEPLSLRDLDRLFGNHVQPYILPFSALISVPPPNSSDVIQPSPASPLTPPSPLSLPHLNQPSAFIIHPPLHPAPGYLSPNPLINFSRMDTHFPPPPTASDCVYPFHSSIRDFLQTSDRTECYRADIARPHKTLARYCFRLLHQEVQNPTTRNKFFAFTYACLYAVDHFVSCQPDDEIQGLFADFLEYDLNHILDVVVAAQNTTLYDIIVSKLKLVIQKVKDPLWWHDNESKCTVNKILQPKIDRAMQVYEILVWYSLYRSSYGEGEISGFYIHESGAATEGQALFHTRNRCTHPISAFPRDIDKVQSSNKMSEEKQ